MSAQSRYTFEPMFATSKGAAGASASTRKRALTEEDLVAARQAGYEEGKHDAMVASERASAEALRAIARMMQMMLGRLADEAQSLRADAAEVALVAARTLAGRALDSFGEEAVLDVVETAVAQLREVPRLVVRVSPEMVETIEERLIGCAREAGFSGEILIRPDPAAVPGDCALDWGDGAIIHNRSAAFELIEAQADKWLASAQAEGLQLDMFQS
jgi:flagellar assembly protein FliH